MLVDLNLPGLLALQKELNLPTGQCIVEEINVTDLLRLAHFIRSIPERMGGLHFCINCSGILGPDYDLPMDQLPDGHWELVSILFFLPALLTLQLLVA